MTSPASLKKVAPLALVLVLGSTGALGVEGEPGSAVVEHPVDTILGAIEQMSDDELKSFYLQCTREAVGGRLSRGHIAMCSVGYERLLKSTFQGNFVALLEWRRSLRRQEPLHSPF